MKRMVSCVIGVVLIFSSAFAVCADEMIQGRYCYTYGDKESLMEAKALARTMAIRTAIESYRTYLTSTTKVSNFSLTNDIVQMISSGYMKNMRETEQSIQGRTVCIGIEAQVSPKEIERAIEKEVRKRSEKLEEQGLDNNGRLKIMTVRKRNSCRATHCIDYIDVIVKSLDSSSDYVFIEYYDENGDLIGGDKKLVHSLITNETKTISFGGLSSSRIPDGMTSYKVRLEKNAPSAVHRVDPTAPSGRRDPPAVYRPDTTRTRPAVRSYDR